MPLKRGDESAKENSTYTNGGKNESDRNQYAEAIENTVNTRVIMADFEIHTTPLEKISIDANSLEILLDDVYENRYKIFVSPYQSVKIITIDCVSSADYFNEYCFRDGRYHRHILQIENSGLIEELKKSGAPASFINNAKHFVLPLQEILIEVIAFELNVEGVK